MLRYLQTYMYFILIYITNRGAITFILGGKHQIHFDSLITYIDCYCKICSPLFSIDTSPGNFNYALHGRE